MIRFNPLSLVMYVFAGFFLNPAFLATTKEQCLWFLGSAGLFLGLGLIFDLMFFKKNL